MFESIERRRPSPLQYLTSNPFDFSNAEAVEWALKIPDFMKIIRVVI
jgi:hypothetical protein